MSCSTCTKTKKLTQCVNEISIGTIAELDTEIYIYFKNVATDRVERHEALSDGAGLVVLDSSLVTFMSGMLYEVWIGLRTASVEDKLPVTIDSVEYDCFQVEFERVWTGAEMEAAISETIEIEA